MMRRPMEIAVLIAIAASSAAAQSTTAPAVPTTAKAPPIPSVAPSSFASEEIRFAGRYVEGEWSPGDLNTEGPAKIRVTYGQPHARGRKIMAGVVPTDSVWRFGANLATELQAEVDFTLGGTFIPRGLYTLFALPSGSGWQLVVSRQNFQWGTDYDRTADFARIPLRSRTLAEPIESLSIYLIPAVDARGTPRTNPHGVMRIVWENTELSADWKLGRP